MDTIWIKNKGKRITWPILVVMACLWPATVSAAMEFITPVNITASTTNNVWSPVDVSDYFSNPVSGVVVQVSNNHFGTDNIGARKNGSTDNDNTSHHPSMETIMIGVDNDEVMEIYRDNHTLWLVGGFTSSAAHFFTNRITVTPGSLNTWTDTDITPYLQGGDTAIAAIVEQTVFSGQWRQNGSTDSFDSARSTGLAIHRFVIVPLDGNGVMELQKGSASAHFYLVGYIKAGSGWTFHTNFPDRTPAGTGWQDVSAAPDPTAEVAMYQFAAADGSGGYSAGVRPNGLTSPAPYANTKQVMYQLQLMTALDGNGLAEVNVSNTNLDVYEVGWWAPPASDSDPPTPDPMTFFVAPDDAGPTSIDMTATTATDAGGADPVEYYFSFNACALNGGGGGTDSGWQTSTVYTDSGLEPNKCYGYTITARDALGNTTATSSVVETYTAANVPGAPSLSNQSSSTIDIDNNENGNPTADPDTTFAIQVLNTSPTDSTWEGKYADATGEPSDTPVWLTDAEADAVVLSGLIPGTYYEVRVKARNADNEETDWSATSNRTTEESVTRGILILGHVRLQGVRLR